MMKSLSVSVMIYADGKRFLSEEGGPNPGKKQPVYQQLPSITPPHAVSFWLSHVPDC